MTRNKTVYVYRAALLCSECGQRRRAVLRPTMPASFDPDEEQSYDSDNFPKGPFPVGESDYLDYCDECGIFLHNRLTTEGRALLVEEQQWASA